VLSSPWNSFFVKTSALSGKEEKTMISAVIERGAVIDVGKTILLVCSMVGPLDQEPLTETCTFGTTNADLDRLRCWLVETGCTHVAMESTGSYWRPVFNVLEESLTLVLANAEDVKGRRGHKTDPKDSQMACPSAASRVNLPQFYPAKAST
jgi:transposase